MKNVLLCAFVLLGAVSIAHADVELLGWDPSSLTNYGPNNWSPTTTGTGITSVAGISRGAGLETGTTGVHGWGGISWSGTTESAALSNQEYFTFGFTVASGYSVSIKSLSEAYRRGANSPDSGELQYSINGSAFNDVASLAFTNTFSTGDVLSLTLSSVSALQNLSAGTVLSFRQANWYASGSPDTSAGWYIFNHDAGDDFSLFGTATSVGTLPVGDVDGDGHVNAKDVKVMLGALTNLAGYETTYGFSPTTAANNLDVNHDSKVNNSDLQWLINHLKTGNGMAAAVPEPSTFLLALLSATIMAAIAFTQR